MPKQYQIEVCVESLEEALAAQNRGADQVELCARLDLDGLTPDGHLIKICLETLDIPVKVMIRPRAGGFEYTDKEWEEMLLSIDICRFLGVKEIVTGVLTGQKVDLARLEEIVKWAEPMGICFHKAIDATFKPVEEVRRIRKSRISITSVLSSGGAPTALEGAEVLKHMHEAAGNDFHIIGAGRITPQNLDRVAMSSGLTWFHGRRILGEGS